SVAGPGVAGGQRAGPIRAPGAQALGGQLNLTRALRPLKRKVPSRRDLLFDEEATASRIAEEGLWVPTLTPAPTRWLELALVVDGYESMSIWRQTIAELRALLESLGTFRDVRHWTLDHQAHDVNQPAVRRRREGSALRSPRELIDPTGNRVIIVLSDCLGPMWQSQSAQQVLAEWARHGPVAVVQPLPQRLWAYSHAQPVPARLHAFQPGAPNERLICRTTAGSSASRPRNSVAVPILELDAAWLASWSRLLVASGTTGVDSLVIFASRDPGPVTENPVRPRQSLTPFKRVQDFRATASPGAVRLAEFLAAAPISLPVIRLVGQVMLNSTSQSQVAEVFLGGLLCRLDGQEGLDPDDVLYDFMPGVREILIRRLRRGDALRTLQEVSQFVGARLGQARDFRALLAGVGLDGELLIDPDSRPFARVTAQVLRLLGGQYTEQAQRIAAALPEALEEPAQLSPEIGQLQPEVGEAPAPAGTKPLSPGPMPSPEETEPAAARHGFADADEDHFAQTLAQLSFDDRRGKKCPLVCPYCYHAFAERDILFRCSGRAGPGRPGCTPEPDDELGKLLGKPVELPPVFPADAHRDLAACPRCNRPTRAQVCPACHKLLPATFRAVQGRLIALVGPSDAGKTAFMTVLIHEMRHRVGERLNSSTMGADENTQEDFVNFYEWPMYERFELKLTPPKQDHIIPLVFRFAMNQRGLIRHSYELLLSFADSAGEDLMEKEKIELMARYLAAADAVIVLIDPLQFESVRRQVSQDNPVPRLPGGTREPTVVFDRITRLLQAGAGQQVIEKPVAIVLSKIDALWQLLPEGDLLRVPRPVLQVFDSKDSLALQRQARVMLDEWGASSIDRTVREHYKVCRYFAVSALGASPASGNKVPEQGVRPYRVTEPFMWLLNQFGFVKSG
ncbi:MAG: SAV_2336 N-terminal domain-related protein, partial [Streptosporangiaceae bacterium]